VSTFPWEAEHDDDEPTELSDWLWADELDDDDDQDDEEG
jgi:hypothetical protein